MQRAAQIAVALDTADETRLGDLARTLGPHVGFLKVGLEAYLAHGPRMLEKIARHAPVFLDLKLHDIPNTVASAIRTLRGSGATLLTIHCSGGTAMLNAAREAAGDDLGLLGVTVLTSLEHQDLRDLGVIRRPRTQVLRLAGLAQQAGLTGVVCSPLELRALRAQCPRPFFLVTPGIRPEGAPAHDQRRTATPSAALATGADLLVIGRPVVAAPDPVAALDRIVAALPADRGTRR